VSDAVLRFVLVPLLVDVTPKPVTPDHVSTAMAHFDVVVQLTVTVVTAPGIFRVANTQQVSVFVIGPTSKV
jgi:hypothetical protein